MKSRAFLGNLILASLSTAHVKHHGFLPTLTGSGMVPLTTSTGSKCGKGYTYCGYMLQGDGHSMSAPLPFLFHPDGLTDNPLSRARRLLPADHQQDLLRRAEGLLPQQHPQDPARPGRLHLHERRPGEHPADVRLQRPVSRRGVEQQHRALRHGLRQPQVLTISSVRRQAGWDVALPHPLVSSPFPSLFSVVLQHSVIKESDKTWGGTFIINMLSLVAW